MVKGKIAIEPDEAAGLGAPITQMFADELGWRELEAEVARVYRALPQTERSRTAIFAANYGEAAAIDVFGVADSLPRATSGENQYYLWGPPSDDTRDVIVVNGDPNQWRGRCGGVEQAGEFGAPLAMRYRAAAADPNLPRFAPTVVGDLARSEIRASQDRQRDGEGRRERRRGAVKRGGGPGAKTEERLKATAARSGFEIKSSRRAPGEPDETCWPEGDGCGFLPRQHRSTSTRWGRPVRRSCDRRINDFSGRQAQRWGNRN